MAIQVKLPAAFAAVINRLPQANWFLIAGLSAAIKKRSFSL
jgi:hypothetical protein